MTFLLETAMKLYGIHCQFGRNMFGTLELVVSKESKYSKSKYSI